MQEFQVLFLKKGEFQHQGFGIRKTFFEVRSSYGSQNNTILRKFFQSCFSSWAKTGDYKKLRNENKSYETFMFLPIELVLFIHCFCFFLPDSGSRIFSHFSKKY